MIGLLFKSGGGGEEVTMPRIAQHFAPEKSRVPRRFAVNRLSCMTKYVVQLITAIAVVMKASLQHKLRERNGSV